MRAPLIIGFLVCTVVLWAFTRTNEDAAARALEQAGYTNVNWTGYTWFACSNGDWSQTGFLANGPAGTVTSGTVCCGLVFKYCTVRH